MDDQREPESIAVEWRFAAPVSAVWRAWTRPALVKRWWGSDPDGVVTAAVLDVQRGGRFEIAFRDPSGDEHVCFGGYLRVVHESELEFTWSWRGEANAPSRVRVCFLGDGGGTRMRFRHGELRGSSIHDYAAGWRRTFAKLDRVLAERGRPPGAPLSAR